MNRIVMALAKTLLRVCGLAALLLGTACTSVGVVIQQTQNQSGQTPSAMTINGSGKGDLVVDYQPSISTESADTIRADPKHTATRRHEIACAGLDVSNAGGSKTVGTGAPGATAAGGAFDSTLELQGIRFIVTSANEGSQNTLRIVPSGLEIDNSPIVRTIDGIVTGAEVADLNMDGSPEIYVYVTSAGSGSYGSLVAYSANRRKSLSEIYLPPVTQYKVAAKGYMGHDEFAVGDGVLLHRFPIYNSADTNAKPTGGTRQLQYKLVPGEAGWLLKLERTIEY